MTLNQLRNESAYAFHHTASRKGYESRKDNEHIEPYNGKFGEGYIHVQPRWDTSQYVYITYYIRKA